MRLSHLCTVAADTTVLVASCPVAGRRNPMAQATLDRTIEGPGREAESWWGGSEPHLPSGRSHRPSRNGHRSGRCKSRAFRLTRLCVAAADVAVLDACADAAASPSSGRV